MRRSFAHAGALSLAVVAIAAYAASAPINASKSTIVATFTQMSVPVDAPFRAFKGDIDYDPAHIADAKATIVVNTGSFDIGDQDYNKEVRKKAWFDSDEFPTATFTSSTITPKGSNGFEATGTLTIKGKAQTITVPVSVHNQNGLLSFDGKLPLSRHYFGIGDPEWDDVVDDQVNVRFHIVRPA